MNRSLLDLVRCPHDGYFPLTLTDDAPPSSLQADVSEGSVHCPQCRRSYPIQDGILSMLPDPLRQEARRDPSMSTEESATQSWNEKREEMRARDEQAPEYDRFVGDYLDRLQGHHIVRSIGHAEGGRILDIGAGTGRLTLRIRPHASELVALDFSRESLNTLAKRAGPEASRSLHLVQADASFLPFKDEVFDRVISAHVMHHVPLPARADAFSEARRVLRRGAPFVLTVYHYDVYRRLRIRFGLRYPDIEKEGRHAQRIYYHCFTRRELRNELERFFEVERLQGIVTVPREIFSRLDHSPLLQRLASRVDRALSHTAAGSSLGLLLFAVSRRR